VGAAQSVGAAHAVGAGHAGDFIFLDKNTPFAHSQLASND